MPGPSEFETVIVVHGTFSGKTTAGPPRWYAPAQTFCTQLDAALKSGGSTARCWRHLRPEDDYFHWDGSNDWLSRSKAALRLRQQIRQLRSQGWTVHLVGHSHGGNVIIDAITDRVNRIEPWFVGRVVLLGTPLSRESAAFAARREALSKRWTIAALLSWALALFLSTRNLDVLAAFSVGGPTEDASIIVGLAFATAAVILLVRGANALSSSARWLYFWRLTVLPGSASGPKNRERWSPAFMMINSQADEAYRSLAGLRRARILIGADSRATSGVTGNLRAVLESGRSRLSTLVSTTLETPRTGLLSTLGVASFAALLLWKPVLTALASDTLSVQAFSLWFWIVVTVIVITACFEPCLEWERPHFEATSLCSPGL